MDKLFLVIGIPGAGKTTYSSRFSSVLHYDDISKHRMDERIKIQKSTDAECIEGIYNTVESRKRLLECVDRRYKVCIWLDTSCEICIEREQGHRVRPDHLVLYHHRTLQPPTLSEGWDEIRIIKDNDFDHAIVIQPVEGGDQNESDQYRSPKR